MLLWLHRAAELIHGNLVSFSLIIFCMKILLRGYSVMTPQSAKGCVGYLLHFFTTQEKHMCSCGNYGRRKEFNLFPVVVGSSCSVLLQGFLRPRCNLFAPDLE